MLLYGELSILQDSNMVKRKSRLQTHTAIIVGAETELVCVVVKTIVVQKSLM